MSRVRSLDTGLERLVRSALHRRGLRFRKHVRDLPGRPDIVFRTAQVAVFLDGDFWHGYRFPLWQHKLSAFWRTKIAMNRARDARTFRRLRRMGWTVVRVWQHSSRKDLDVALERVVAAVLQTRGPSRSRRTTPTVRQKSTLTAARLRGAGRT